MTLDSGYHKVSAYNFSAILVVNSSDHIVGELFNYTVDGLPAQSFREHKRLQDLTSDRFSDYLPRLDYNDYLEEAGLDHIDGDLKHILRELPVGSTTGWNMAFPKGFRDGYWSPNRAHTSLFQSIFQEDGDGDPAPVIQGLMTRLYQMSYYDQLEEYDLKFPVTTVHTTDRLVPVRWAGLVIVLILVSIHLALVFTTMILFLLKTKSSTLGNAWHALAQAARITDAVEGAHMMLDKEVKKWAEASGRDKDIYRIAKSGYRQDPTKDVICYATFDRRQNEQSVRFHGLTVMTADSDSASEGSTPSETFLFALLAK
ncbi:hypothetical protein FBEOM_6180 [Fusarium beomiforme]|uniref:Uncharacterized protein n=1 Tax=Fusarium beomiforme TaxID=44412 RepID=A0A9P5DWD6_9HYPO|nr:hypothetical protein FBEOM_6180 [Fusarium beomiforme]